MKEPRYVVVANPGGKRWQAYERELLGFWRRRGMEPRIRVVPWRKVVPRLGWLDDIVPESERALFRLESPGRDQEVMRQLLAAGDDPTLRKRDWTGDSFAKTALIRPGLLYKGLSHTLHGLRAFLDQRPLLKPLSCPLAVAELFDKTATSKRLAAAGLPCPRTIAPPTDPGQLIEQLRSQRLKIAYVKLNAGSSATGIAVAHALDDPPWAITSMLRIGQEFHNTRKLRKIDGAELDAALSFLLREGAFVQQGIALAQIDGQNFDVRVVVIHGEPAFTIFRLSGLPMTNLHLGGRRGVWVACRAAVPTRAWLDALDDCARAGQLYGCAAVGVDLVFERGFARHFILEINAFGDFFPGLMDDRGRSVHELEIEASSRKFGLLPCPRSD